MTRRRAGEDQREGVGPRDHNEFARSASGAEPVAMSSVLVCVTVAPIGRGTDKATG